MKKKIEIKKLSAKMGKPLRGIYGLIIFLCISSLTINSCKKDDTNNNTGNNTVTGYQRINLTTDNGSIYAGTRMDANLVNPWGIAIGPTGAFWISANHTGKTTVYDRNGDELLPAIQFPNGAEPTGVVYNSTGSFMGNKFIYCGEDGKIYGWQSGTTISVLVDRSGNGAVYKGIAIAKNGPGDYLYVANFKGNHIDVFDGNMNLDATVTFADPSIPAGFGVFNIYNHDGKLWVAYAKQKGPDNEDDEPGPGNGFINIFNPNGTLDRRFAALGTLNSPWGIVDAPSGFGLGDDMILIGNFGDGRINVFASDGTYKSQLNDNGSPITIDGLWALVFPENGIPAGDQNQLFFTAGPQEETHGVFGYIKKH